MGSVINKLLACSKCKEYKHISNFSFRKERNKYFRRCKLCIKKQRQEYNKKNKDKIKKQRQEHCRKNKERLNKKSKEYYILNKEKCNAANKLWEKKNEIKVKKWRQQYRKDNCAYINKWNKNYQKNRRKDAGYRLRKNISRLIFFAIKKNNGNKSRMSILDYLPYSLIELKQHLEFLFEPWMSWNNLGKYIVNKWDDNDSSTWKWQLDHIIPHSTFHYTSMEDEEFKKCWSLENLRPYSAKLNQLDGCSRIRHKKVNNGNNKLIQI